ncbi:MAG: hypothetical protein EBR73_00425 [Rhodobacteraceae bacterium]|nr:hypothetical protein [Paracoccaceae bacterium]
MTQPHSQPATPRSYYRSPAQVMRLARMGSAHPMRLSFLRILLRRMRQENWRFERHLWQVDARGVGRAVYCAHGPKRSYSLVAFAHDLPDHMRSDRVIATAWDATFALFDGVPSRQDLDRLQQNVPLQEAGRIGPRELTLSRANRSVRLFTHVVGALAAGRQPDATELQEVGYLMRTTAVYGAGKFGAADRADIAQRPEMAAPFQAEMLTVWLIRWFTVDIVNHLATQQGGAQAVALAPELCRQLGVGNSTGLGMAPFLVRHPVLLNNWIFAREEALARVRALPMATPQQLAGLRAALADAEENASSWRSSHPVQVEKLASLRADLACIRCLSADEQASFRINGALPLGQLRQIVAQHYAWALRTDFSDPAQMARFWYVSEEKLEPRLGDRHAEPGADQEQPLAIAHLVQALWADLQAQPETLPLARFLLAHPQHRLVVRRVLRAPSHPFAEVQDNLIADTMLPIDLMRCKLAFFGASHFDPRSDKWVRISLFRGMPYPTDLAQGAPA